jgi:hypothetical protein
MLQYLLLLMLQFELLFEQQSGRLSVLQLVLLLELLLLKLYLKLFEFGFGQLLLVLYTHMLSFAHLPIIVPLL